MIEVIYASVLGLIIPALLLQVSRRVYSHASGRKRYSINALLHLAVCHVCAHHDMLDMLAGTLATS
jgi:hypothetical protein